MQEKTGRLVDLLRREHLGGIVLNAQHNFTWITGGACNGIDLSRENGAANILVTADGRRFVIANNIEMPRLLAEEVAADLFEPIEFGWQEDKIWPELVLDKAARIAGGEIVSDISFGSMTRTIEAQIAKCRFSLTTAEIDRIRKLGLDAAKVLDDLVRKIEIGQSETEIAAKMQAELASHDVAAVVTLVAADERIAAFRHPVPTEKRWDKTLMLVTCAKRRGLIVSLSRIVCVGEVPDELQRRTEATAFANANLWHATRLAIDGSELYATAGRAYEKVGFADEIDKHHQGGAAGYKTREWVAHPNSTDVVQDNQAFAWNPSITGTKIEETILVRGDEIEVITSSNLFPKISTEIDGVTYQSPGILSL